MSFAAHLPLKLVVSLHLLMESSALDADTTIPVQLIGNPAAIAESGQASWPDMTVRAWPGLYRLRVRVEPALQAPYYGTAGGGSTMDKVCERMSVYRVCLLMCMVHGMCNTHVHTTAPATMGTMGM